VLSLEITDDEATPAASERGVVVENGRLELAFTTISGQNVAGVDAAVRGGDDARLDAVLGNLTIEGGQYGIRVHGPRQGGSLALLESTVRDQTVASVSFAVDGSFILAMDTFQIALSVVSGFALEDLRQDADPENPIITVGDAFPLLLNGRSYTELGLVSGPLEIAPDFRIVSESGSISF
jgi:hypothetical protein